MGERHLLSGSGGFVTVGRGPVPRQAANTPTPREGQAPALR